MNSSVLECAPVGVQPNLEVLNPSLYEAAWLKLRAVSHRALYVEGCFPNPYTPIPLEDYEDRQHNQTQRVNELIDKASDALAAAYTKYSSLLDGEDTRLKDLSDLAQAMLLDEAIAAKQTGHEERTVEAIEIFMTLFTTNTGLNDDGSDAKFVQSAVIGGLAEELVFAAHNLQGVVLLSDVTNTAVNNLTDVSRLAQGSPYLLKIASGMDFDKQFSKIEPLADEAASELLEELEFHDFVALSDHNRLQGNAARADEYLEAAAERLLVDDIEISSQDITHLLIKLKMETSIDISSITDKLRQVRQSGSKERHESSLSMLLDETLIALVAEDHGDLANLLLSSSSKDPKQLEVVMQDSVLYSEKQEKITAVIQELHSAKQENLTRELIDKQIDPKLQAEIINFSTDPDAATNIDDAFWELCASLPAETRKAFMEAPDMEQAVIVIKELRQQAMLLHASELLLYGTKFSDPSQLTTYVAAYRELVQYFEENVKQAADDANTALSPADFVCFYNPYQAYSTLATASKDPEDLATIKKFYGFSGDAVIFESIDPEVVSALVKIRRNLETNGLDEDSIHVFIMALHGKRDVSAFIENVLPTIDILRDVTSHQSALVADILHASDQVSLRTALSMIKQSFKGLDPKVMTQLMQDVSVRARGRGDPTAEVQLLCEVENLLQLQDLSLEVVGYKEFKRFWWQLEHNRWLDTEEGQTHLKNYCEALKVSTRIRQKNEKHNLELENFPEILELFESLGFSAKLGQEIFDSWTSFDAFAHMLKYKIRKEEIGWIDESHSERAAQAQNGKLHGEYKALATYAQRYGTPEVRDLIDIFGIHHFSRYRFKQLHRQLLAWKNGKTPVRNILMSAHGDWNGALNRSGNISSQVCGSSGLFCFEVGRPSEISQAAVAVGNRERQFGRDPRDGYVENIIIDTHGSSDSLRLGQEKLHVKDYENAAQARKKHGLKPNTYERHLGRRFRVIVHACEAGMLTKGLSIASSMNRGHHFVVAATDKKSSGYRILNGVVEFAVKNKDGNLEYTPGILYRRIVSDAV